MIFVYLFFLHFLADFVLQPREMGRKKSSNFKYLGIHIAIQIIVFTLGLWPILGLKVALLIALGNGVIHGIIDAVIWKGYAWSVWLRRRDKNITKENLKVTWKYWDDHFFYLTIGLDQFLHISTIIIVFMWVII